jgi:uncharacterized protein YkwD
MTGQTLRVLVACLMASCMVAVPAQARMTGGERKVIKRVNNLRASYGLARVFGDGRLAHAAGAHGRDMLRADFFAHDSSNGTSTFDRVRHYRHSNLIGETLAYMPAGGRTSARSVVDMWINSPGHLEVLTTGRFQRIGVDKRRGTLSGQRVTVWTVDLASRR